MNISIIADAAKQKIAMNRIGLTPANANITPPMAGPSIPEIELTILMMAFPVIISFSGTSSGMLAVTDGWYAACIPYNISIVIIITTTTSMV